MNAVLSELYIFGYVAIGALFFTSARCFKLMMCGLRWGDLQCKSRSSDYFLVACGVVVPLLVILSSYEARAGSEVYGGVSEI